MAERRSTRPKKDEEGRRSDDSFCGFGIDDREMIQDFSARRMTMMEQYIENSRVEMKALKDDVKEVREVMKEQGKSGGEGIAELKKEIAEMKEELERTKVNADKEIEQLKAENRMLKEEREKWKRSLETNDEKVKRHAESLEFMKEEQKIWKEEQTVWKKGQEERKIDFKLIIDQQNKENKENLEKEVIRVIKKKEALVRDTVDKNKCVIVFGLKERVQPVTTTRERDELVLAKEVVASVKEVNSEIEEEVEEVYRLGRYKEGGERPMKIKFRSQTVVNEIINRTWKLSENEKFKKVWIRRDLNEEERKKMSELYMEAKQKNDQRKEEEMLKFYWRVKDSRLRKWYVRRVEEREQH